MLNMCENRNKSRVMTVFFNLLSIKLKKIKTAVHNMRVGWVIHDLQRCVTKLTNSCYTKANPCYK